MNDYRQVSCLPAGRHVLQKTNNYKHMKKTILLFGILLSFTFLNAQQLDPIDVLVSQYPKTFNNSEELAVLINKDFDTDKDKARAIYSWITMNVKYDVKAHFSKKKKKRIKSKNRVDRAQKIRKYEIQLENKALSKHLAVTEGYTVLFKRLCDLTGVYGYVLKGTAKLRTFDIGKQPRVLNHSWNVVQIDKEWFFVDATLGAGTVDYMEKTYQHFFNDKYFFTPPEKFFLNHFPKEKGWLFVEKTADDFSKLPLFIGEYLKNDYELIEPYKGVLDLKGKDSIQFIIKSPVPIEKLTYQFSYEKEPSAVGVELKNGEYTFDIPFIVKRRGYLNLFCNKKAFLSYKIGAY
jgi:transglutaminase/protease-like cytokinesis protein 3